MAISPEPQLHIPHIGVPDRLRAARVDAGLTQEQLAERLDVSKTTIVNYESRSWPRQRRTGTIKQWAFATGVPAAWIIDGPGRDEGPDPDGVGTSDECVPRGSNPDPSDSRSATVTSINTAKPRHALPQAA